MPIYCTQCGKESVDDARFCSACGRPLKPGATPYNQPGEPGNVSGSSFSGSTFRTLMRPRVGRKIAGVCQGLANHYGWDVTIVRVVMVLLAIVGFPIGLIVYGLVWLMAPEEAFALPSSTTYVNQP